MVDAVNNVGIVMDRPACAVIVHHCSWHCQALKRGVRVCGIAVIGFFLVRCCANFYFKVRYCGFQSPSGVR